MFKFLKLELEFPTIGCSLSIIGTTHTTQDLRDILNDDEILIY